MAITEPASARVIRGMEDDHVGDHPFAAVSDLPRLVAGRPRQTGNHALDAIRTAGWDEGFDSGRAQGAEDGYVAGFEQGLAEGRAAGHREGLETAQAEARRQIEARVADSLDALDVGVADLAGREAVTFAEVEATAVDLAIALAESILDREVATADDPGRDALRRALALAPDHDELVAHLHPDDLEALGEVSDLAPGRALTLVSDPSTRRGGCLVAAGAARLDARIDTALERAREALAP